MEGVLQRKIVLELNKNWQRTKWRTVEEAIVALCVPAGATRANMLVIPTGPTGIEGHPITWDEWIALPVRECDLAIRTKNKAIRVPLAIIAPNYGEMPVKEPELTNQAILERDQLIDQYTGEKLKREEANVDHVIPRKVWKERRLAGSPDRWDNLVTTRKERNFKKGSKMNFQMKMRLIRKPKSPNAVPAHVTINTPRHPFQIPFFEHIKHG